MTPKRGGRGGSKKSARGRVGRPPLRARPSVPKYDEDSTSSGSDPVKSSPTEDETSPTANTTPPPSPGTSTKSMKMTMCTAPTMVPRSTLAATDSLSHHHHHHHQDINHNHRSQHPTSPGKDTARLGTAGRRPGKRVPFARHYAGKIRSMVSRKNIIEDPDYPTNDSNDSGLGFDQHGESHAHNLAINDRLAWPEDRSESKRRTVEVKVEHDEVNENYTFPERNTLSSYGTNMLIRTAPSSAVVATLSNATNNGTNSSRAVPRCLPLVNRSNISSPITLTTQLSHTSRYMDVSLSILCQPEQQHRARYQTEGSRGAVKDRSGNGFPIVKLTGYNKPATLQVFIGTDLGKVAPHMFYQACRVSGKNSTPCTEKKMDGTIVIELQLEPSKDMVATCDCVGILKERNVDVEHRFPDQLANRSKKKSTRCRMVFRTYITHDDGQQETLQVCSQPIVCTQPPGIPEISKKSLTSCPATGGLELFILGKNFLKDTLVYFQLEDEDRQTRWEQSVAPDKEYLQQTHLVCVVPAFMQPETPEPCTVRLYVVSSGKCSESHQFVYTPVVVNGAMPSVRLDAATHSTVASTAVVVGVSSASSPFLQKILWPVSTSSPATVATTTTSIMQQQEQQDIGMMPPPETSMVPLSTQRRPSISTPSSGNPNCSCQEVHSPPLHRCTSSLKQELMDESSQNSMMDCLDQQQQHQRFRLISDSSMDVHQTDSNMSMMNENSMDMMRHNGIMNDNSNHSLINENNMDIMVRRNNSFSRSYCENSMDMHNTSSMDMHTNNSMDMHNTNSNLSPSHDDNSCHSIHQQNNSHLYSQNSLLSNGSVSISNGNIMHSDLSNASVEELKVIDLRTPKLPMATVADLVSTNAPSLATLQSFGVTESTNMPLQAQSVQSIENYLTNLDKVSQSGQPQLTMSMLSSAPIAETSFLTSQQSLELSHVLSSVVKSESAAIAEIARQSNAISSTASAMVESAILPASAINTRRLDALVNCAVDSHINNLQQSKDLLIDSSSSMSPQDVILNAPMAPIINTVTMTSPNLVRNGDDLSTDIILNSQVSPSIMCRTNTETLMTNTMCQVGVTNTVQAMLTPPLPLTSPLRLSVSEPEKAIILNAAVDLFETQKQLNELQTKQAQLEGLLTTSNNSFRPFNNAPPIALKSMELMPVLSDQSQSAAEQQLSEKKNEDRMIPPTFPSLSENELINIINPSCFDQV